MIRVSKIIPLGLKNNTIRMMSSKLISDPIEISCVNSKRYLKIDMTEVLAQVKNNELQVYRENVIPG